MVRKNRRSSVDELAKLASDLVDQVKVLVTAVDDLRCEVEWWSRNAADERWQAQQNSSYRSNEESPCDLPESNFTPPDSADAQEVAVNPTELIAATPAVVGAPRESLEDQERRLMQGPIAELPTEWDEDEPPELATGCIIEVDQEIWNWFVEYRPAHVVNGGCCCEAGFASPYLLAWQTEEGNFVRELTDGEAVELQQACLTAHCLANAGETGPTAMQLGLWRD